MLKLRNQFICSSDQSNCVKIIKNIDKVKSEEDYKNKTNDDIVIKTVDGVKNEKLNFYR